MRASVVGMDLGGTRLLIRGAEVEETFRTGPSFTPEKLLQFLESFIARHAIRPECIGLAIPGLVGSDGCVADCDVLPAFRDWPAGRAMQTHATQVAVLNDAEAALLEEMHAVPAGTTGGVIMVGTAVGAAFLVNGQPLRGASGWAGELGYLPVHCSTGVKRLDELAGGAAIADGCGVTAEDLALRAGAGEPVVLQAIERAGASFGLGLAAVINLLNPSVLSVGGGTSELPGYWQAALASAEQHSIAALWRSCTLARVKSGHRVVVLGAMRAVEQGGRRS